uniref:Uncharacterized protein n=1 Tax=Siphoviridae sp. ctSA812 TaxID=2825508 RepID=A0A8S5U3H9_9CAUD|nr:MAG TPA: hypothetical protein [Siphoviridae sp. ctSA812]
MYINIISRSERNFYTFCKFSSCEHKEKFANAKNQFPLHQSIS